MGTVILLGRDCPASRTELVPGVTWEADHGNLQLARKSESENVTASSRLWKSDAGATDRTIIDA